MAFFWLGEITVPHRLLLKPVTGAGLPQLRCPKLRHSVSGPVAAIKAYMAIWGISQGPFFKFADSHALTKEKLTKHVLALQI